MMAADPRLDKVAAPGGVIVVVDDDPAIRELCVDGLTEAGYRVEAFGRGDEALEMVAGMRVDVLVVDWKMPSLSGAEVARRARALNPRLPILMITGSRHEALAASDLGGLCEIMDKPFDVDDFVRAVAALAAQSGDDRKPY